MYKIFDITKEVLEDADGNRTYILAENTDGVRKKVQALGEQGC